MWSKYSVGALAHLYGIMDITINRGTNDLLTAQTQHPLSNEDDSMIFYFLTNLNKTNRFKIVRKTL